MKVFVSWSGDLSRRIALVLREWLPNVMEGVETYVSSEDIGKGARWFADLSKELEDAQFGIVCVTRENIAAPWILFEAGSIAKSVAESRLVPLLIDLAGVDLEGPLTHFQYSSTSKADLLKLVKAINSCRGEMTAKEQRLEKQFDKWFPEIESSLAGAVTESTSTSAKIKRSTQEVMEEVLELTRETGQTLSRLQTISEKAMARSPYTEHPSPYEDAIFRLLRELTSRSGDLRLDFGRGLISRGTEEDKEFIRFLWKLMKWRHEESLLGRNIIITPYEGAYGVAGHVIAIEGSPPRGVVFVPSNEIVVVVVVFRNRDAKTIRRHQTEASTRNIDKITSYLKHRGYQPASEM